MSEQESKKKLSRDETLKLTKDIVEILKKEGFTPQPLPIDISQCFKALVRGSAGGWLDPIDSSLSSLPSSAHKVNSVDRGRLDKTSLKVALLLSEAGVKDLRYNETLNVVKSVVIDMLESMGYTGLSVQSPMWGIYTLHAEIKRKDGCTEEDIAESCAWWKDWAEKNSIKYGQ